MNPELEPLDADVLAILQAEKPIADLEPAAKAAILASIEARIGLLPPPGGSGDGGSGGGAAAGGSGTASDVTASSANASTTAGLTAARVVAAISLTFVAGTGTGIAIAPAVRPLPTVELSHAVVEHQPERPSTPATAAPSGSLTVSVDNLPAAAAPSAAPAKVPGSTGSDAPSSRGLAAERSLLDVARSALARGEAGDALGAVERHAREYPTGVLVEEREALAIKSLVSLGRRDEARARALTFEQRFPSGLMLHTVKSAVGEP